MKNLLLAAVTVLLVVLLLEAILRIVPREQITVNDPYAFTEVIGKREFREPYRSYKERYPLRFDSRGYYAKSDGIISYYTNQYGARWSAATNQLVQRVNVMVMGDSFTYGFGLRYEDSFVPRLEHLLAAAGRTIGFLNIAVPAANVQSMLTRYRDLRDFVPHDSILYCLHINDLIPFRTSYVATHSNSSLGWLTSRLGQTSAFLGFVSRRVHDYFERQNNIQVMLDPSQFETEYFEKNMRAMKRLHAIATRRNIPFRVVLLPILVDLKKDTFDPLYRGIRHQLDGSNIPYLDLTSSLKGHEDESMWILPFDQHPNEVANRIFAEQLARIWLADPVQFEIQQ